MTTSVKFYKTSIPGSRFIDKEGISHYFDEGGYLEVADEELQKELDKVAGKSGCPIFAADKRVNMPGLSASGALTEEEAAKLGKTEEQMKVDPVQQALAQAAGRAPSVTTGTLGSAQVPQTK